MLMRHTGTCNDGVGKGACGGEIIVCSPNANPEDRQSENVLIGNFALFGATGGRTFIAGQAGDRFAVRNSGATAVVEGVGDFCCEYMTNGTVLNLGGFSKGFGNGMSGGFAYQYDPEGLISAAASHDSVLIGKIDDANPMAAVHAQAVEQLLQWHWEATLSSLAKQLLDNWQKEREHFAWIMPRALLQYQDADAILAAKSRKALLEELASALASHQIQRLKKAWKDNDPVLYGAVPEYGETDTEEMFLLLNNWTILETAQSIASKRIGAKASSPLVQKTTRNLVLTEDFGLMTQLAKHARSSLADYDDPSLAALVAHKRLSDFKHALSLRNILSMDSPTTYGWILHQSQKNRAQLGEIPSFEALFARNALPESAARALAE